MRFILVYENIALIDVNELVCMKQMSRNENQMISSDSSAEDVSKATSVWCSPEDHSTSIICNGQFKSIFSASYFFIQNSFRRGQTVF